MVLVDTSVWIRFLANRAPVAGQLDELLRHGEVCGHDFVFGELLIAAARGYQHLPRVVPPQVSRARSVSRRAVRRISRQECS
jgi:predicted nucleic acid-binding protein